MKEKSLFERQDKIILWEKWRDPFGTDSEEHEWPGAYGNFTTDKIIDSSKVGHVEEDEYDSDQDHEEYTQEDIEKAMEEHQRKQMQAQKRMPFIHTNMGLIPMTEHARAGKLFNFWTAHTNFPITQEIKDTIDEFLGIETLDIFTPYRWRISIGKAFNSPKVKNGLTDALGAKSPK